MAKLRIDVQLNGDRTYRADAYFDIDDGGDMQHVRVDAPEDDAWPTEDAAREAARGRAENWLRTHGFAVD